MAIGDPSDTNTRYPFRDQWPSQELENSEALGPALGEDWSQKPKNRAAGRRPARRPSVRCTRLDSMASAEAFWSKYLPSTQITCLDTTTRPDLGWYSLSETQSWKDSNIFCNFRHNHHQQNIAKNISSKSGTAYTYIYIYIYVCV